MQNWKFAISSIMSHKLRSFLTMVGIIIGVASVVVIMALGDGMKAGVTKTFTKDMVIGILALVFSFWFVFGSGEKATFYAYLLILAGYVVLLGLYVKRKRRGLPVEGDSTPPLTDVPGEKLPESNMAE